MPKTTKNQVTKMGWKVHKAGGLTLQILGCFQDFIRGFLNMQPEISCDESMYVNNIFDELLQLFNGALKSNIVNQYLSVDLSLFS